MTLLIIYFSSANVTSEFLYLQGKSWRGFTTSSPLVVLDTCPGRGPKWVPKCIDFGFDLVVLAVTGGWGSCFVSPLSSGETGGGMKGGRGWWLSLVGSEEKAVKGLLVVKVLMGTV